MATSKHLEQTTKQLPSLRLTSFEPSRPLTKFTIFPKLATELRLQIWNHALPDDDRVLHFTISHGVSNDPDDIKYKFKPDHDESAKEDYIQLLVTSKEARMVVLKGMPNTLPAVWGGNIQFSDRTIVTIRRFEKFFLKENQMIFNFDPIVINRIAHELRNIKRYQVDNSFFAALFSLGVPLRFWVGRFMNLVVLGELVLEDSYKSNNRHVDSYGNTKTEMVGNIDQLLAASGHYKGLKVTYLGWRKDNE